MEVIVIATVIEVTVVLLVLAILYAGSQLIQKKKITRTQKKHSSKGIEANAIILTMEETGQYTNKQPQVKLQVQVLPERGRNFVTEIKPVLSLVELDSIKTGTMVTVLYNPSNIKEVSFVRVSQD
jgi:hypothetical protein